MLDESLETATATKKAVTKKRSPKKPRTPDGWSVRPKPNGGRSPICKVCHMQIKQNETALVRKFMVKTSNKFPDVHFFHCRVSCLERVEGKGKKDLLKKKWSQKEVQQVMEQVARLANSDSD
jgi:hypothetical protein